MTPPTSPPAPPCSLLIVEDDEGLARLQRLRLERAGYRVVIATNAAEGLEQIRQDGIDLILLDQRLPGGTSGLDLFRQIRAAGWEVPAILVTAFSEENIILQALRAGVHDFVPKTPEYLDHLLPAVARVLKERQAERQLAESEARLAGIVETALDAVLTVDVQGRITLFNRAAEEMFGCPAAEAIGQAVQRCLPAWSGEVGDGQPVGNPVGDGARRRWETEGRRADDESFPVEVAVSCVDRRGRRFCTCIVRDLSERRRAEKEREGLIREQAARAEAERAEQEMARLVEDLREADQRKDEFLAMLAHELRNPLAPIRNALHLIRLRDDERRVGARRAWEIIERQVEHLVRLVDDLLDVSRITRGKINLVMQRIDLADVVARAVESSRPLIESRRHLLAVTLPPAPLFAEGDPVRLAQVFMNLLNNAAKYTPEGGHIDLIVETAAACAPAPATSNPSSWVAVRVRDTGMGIPREMLPRVFDLFTQAERTLDRAEGGLGIGLTLVRRLTEKHGGRVEVFSAGPGQGSEFVVSLPLLEGSSAPPANPNANGSPEQTARPPGRRILVVDDNRDSAESLALLLRLCGHDVRTAHDGRQALAVAAAYRPDVALLDIGLPGISGYEVAQQLRAIPALREVVLVALTGYGGEEDRRLSRAAGFADHLVKPVELETLQRLLASLSAASTGAGS